MTKKILPIIFSLLIGISSADTSINALLNSTEMMHHQALQGDKVSPKTPTSLPPKSISNIQGSSNDNGASVNSSSQTDAVGNVLLQAISLMGIPYRWGGNTPESGMDCSGFIRYVFKKSLGITLPRTVAGMAKVGKRVTLQDIQPGDLIIFNTLGRNTHIGMYIGDNQFIQSPRTGERIQVSKLNDYWKARINGIKRIVQEDPTVNGGTDVQTFEDDYSDPLPTGGVRRGHRRYRGKYHRRSTHSTIGETRHRSHSGSKYRRGKVKPTSRSARTHAMLGSPRYLNSGNRNHVGYAANHRKGSVYLMSKHKISKSHYQLAHHSARHKAYQS